jgi:hypothetical protein
MENYKQTRNYLTRLAESAGLTLERTLGDLRARVSAEDWSTVEERVTVANFNEETTILELLAAIQSADAPPEDD